MPPQRQALPLRWWDRQRVGLLLLQRDLLDVLNQSERFVFVAPKIRRVTACRDELSTAVFLVDNVTAQIAQRRLEHIKDEFGPGSSTRWTCAQFSTELVLMFRFGEIPQGVGRCAEKHEPPALVEQDHLLKHLENLRARLVNGNYDDFVVCHAPNDFDYVLRILRGETGSWFVKQINVRHSDHIEPDIE